MRAVHPLSSARSDSPPSGRQNHKVITNKKHVRRTLGNTHLLARVLIHKSNTTVANVNRQRRTIRVIHLHSAPIQRQHHVRASKLTPRRHIIDQRHRLTGTSATGNENRRNTTANRSTSRVGSVAARKGVFHARANVRRQAHRKLQLIRITHVARQKPISKPLSKQPVHAIGANHNALTITTAGRHERKAEQESNSAPLHLMVKRGINKNIKQARVTPVDEHAISRKTTIPQTHPTKQLSPTRPHANANAARQLLRPRTRVTFASHLADVNATLVRVTVQLLAR